MAEEVVLKILASYDEGDTTWGLSYDAMNELARQYGQKKFTNNDAREVLELIVRRVFSSPEAPLPYPPANGMILNDFGLGNLVLGVIVTALEGGRRMVVACSKRELKKQQANDGPNRFRGIR